MRWFHSFHCRVALLLAISSAFASAARTIGKKRASTDRLVFAHFMMGIVANRNSADDYDADMTRAKALGIDAFALNIGTDDYTDTQLGYAYQSAEKNGMKVFISFDFNWFTTSQGSDVGAKIKKYAGLSAQLKVDNKAFVSSFVGDGVDTAAIRTAAGQDIFWAPNFNPGLGTDFSVVDAAFNWMAWPNNNANRAPTAAVNKTVKEGDNEYIDKLAGKPYLAPVSPWFFTHYGQEVSYSKNWVFPSDLLWFQRWNEILALGPRFVEIITWNDYGESHYIGPLSSPHSDDGNSKWVNDMPHGGWADMAKPFISAYHNGATSADSFIDTEQIIYWYRPQLSTAQCDSTDNYGSKPDGADVSMADKVFIVTLLKQAGKLTVYSGGKPYTFDAPAGARSFSVPLAVGSQNFTVTRNGTAVLSGASLKNVIDGCVCGLYNFNAYVGTVPAQQIDSLQPAGLASFTTGLKVQTCQATPTITAAGASATAYN